jgi:excisionase family DNA binding protein
MPRSQRVSSMDNQPSRMRRRDPSARVELPGQMLTADDVADLLRVTRRHVYSLVDRGVLRCHKIGRLLRFSPEDLAACLESARESTW